jgi:hypothetical protein
MKKEKILQSHGMVERPASLATPLGLCQSRMLHGCMLSTAVCYICLGLFSKFFLICKLMLAQLCCRDIVNRFSLRVLYTTDFLNRTRPTIIVQA